MTTMPYEYLTSLGLSPLRVAAVVCNVFFAGVVSGLSGFAFSAIAACLIWLLQPLQAVALLMMLSTCNQVLSAGRLRREMRLLNSKDEEGALPYIAGGLVGVPLGLHLLFGLAAEQFAAGMGLFLVAYGGFLLFKPGTFTLTLSGRTPALVVGALGGVVGGFSAFPGSVPIVYFTLRGKNKSETRGVVQPYILSLQIVSLFLLAWTNGAVFDRRFGLLFATTLPATLIGTLAGVGLYRRMSDLNFRRAVLALLVVSGMSLIGKGLIHWS